MLCHVQSAHFKPVVAAVFENHAVFLHLLRKVNELPAFFEVHCRRHFVSNVLAVLQCAFSNGEVVCPVGCDVNEVDVRASAEFLIAVFARIDGCGGKSSLAELFVLCNGASFNEVAECNDFNARENAEIVDSTRAAHTETNEADAYGFVLWQLEAENVLLTSGACRSFNYDGTLVPMPFC